MCIYFLSFDSNILTEQLLCARHCAVDQGWVSLFPPLTKDITNTWCRSYLLRFTTCLLQSLFLPAFTFDLNTQWALIGCFSIKWLLKDIILLSVLYFCYSFPLLITRNLFIDEVKAHVLASILSPKHLALYFACIGSKIYVWAMEKLSKKKKGKLLSDGCCLIYLASKSHVLTTSFTVNNLQKATVRLKLFVLLKCISSGEVRRKKGGGRKSLPANRPDI